MDDHSDNPKGFSLILWAGLGAVLIAVAALGIWFVRGGVDLATQGIEQVSAPPRQLIVALDLSSDGPLLTSSVYVKAAARRVSARVSELPTRSVLTLRTFGDYDPDLNKLRIDQTISRSFPAQEGARLVEGVLLGIPTLLEKGQVASQNATNILGFLENMSGVTSCTGTPADIVLLTDGVEKAEYVDLSGGQGTLPPPPSPTFEGCGELVILGLGQGTGSPAETARLRKEWSAWAEAAGFSGFVGFNDW